MKIPFRKSKEPEEKDDKDTDKDDKKDGDDKDKDKDKDDDLGDNEKGQSESDDDKDSLDDIEGDEMRHEEEVSQDAIFWAEDLFQDKSYAKYYNLCKDRSADDVRSMLVMRPWKVRIRNIQYRNYGELGDFFVKFNFGWNFKLSRRFLRVKASGRSRKQKKDKSGRPIEEKRKWKWVKEGTMGKKIYSGIVRDVDKGQTVDFPDEIEFHWFGTYFDLYNLMLHAEVWIYNQYNPNEMLAMAEKSLYEIATGSMNMAGPEWEIKKEIRRKGRKVKVTIGALEFQCVLQEILNYSMKFQNWSVKFYPHEALTLDENEDEILYPYLRFHLHSPHNLLKSTSTKSRKLTFHGKDRAVRIEATPSDGMISFTGTRIEFEQSILFVHLYDSGLLPFNDDCLGSARVPLTNVVDGGFLSARLSKSKRVRWRDQMVCHNTNEVQSNETGRVYGTCDIEVSGSRCWRKILTHPMIALHSVDNRLYREFAQIGDLQPPELKDYPPFNYSYLAVRIVSATNLIGADTSGLSDPYCTVEWGDQRQKTKTIHEELNPIFDETLYFQVPAFNAERISKEEISDYPFARICVWDADETGSSDLLGWCKLYLHEITGTDDGGTRNLPRPKRVNVKRRKRRGQRKLRDEVIMTRTFEREFRLEGLPNGVESFVKVIAFFRAPGEGDLKEYDERLVEKHGTDLLLLPDMVKKEKEQLYSCLCSGKTKGKTKDGKVMKRQTCQSVQDGRPCDQFRIFYEETQRRSPERYRMLKVLEDHLNLNNLRGINQFGDRHFLCTFLQPVSPPRSFIDPTEAAFMSIRSSQKPNSCYKAAKFVRGMEFWDYVDSFFDGCTTINPDVWLTPTFFASMKKGDVKAHVLMLANFFIGLMTDAYVCLGYAKNEDDKEVPYVWVMTRESTSNGCTSASMDRGRKGKSAFEAAFDKTDKPKAIKMEHIGGAIKFWEVTHGAYYSPLANRWSGQDDDEVLQASKTKKRKKRVKRNNILASNQDDRVNDNFDEAYQGNRFEVELAEEDLLVDKRQDDVTVGVDEIFALGPDIGDTYAPPANRLRGASSTTDYETGDHKIEDIHVDVADTPNNDEEDPDDEMLPENVRKERDEKLAEDKSKYTSRRQWVKNHFQAMQGNPEFDLPYTKILAVFNHENFWVNIQDSLDPRAIVYDMEMGPQFGWLNLVKRDNKFAVHPHYTPQMLGSKLTEAQMQRLQKQMYSEITTGIENHRIVHNITTRFTEEGAVARLVELLEARLDLDMLDRSSDNGWVHDATMSCGGYWRPSNKEFRRVRSITKSLLLSAPPGYKCRISCIKVNNSDPREVRKFVLQKPPQGKSNQARVPIFEETHESKEIFAVGVKVHSWPNGLCNAYVALMVVFPDETVQERTAEAVF